VLFAREEVMQNRSPSLHFLSAAMSSSPQPIEPPRIQEDSSRNRSVGLMVRRTTKVADCAEVWRECNPSTAIHGGLWARPRLCSRSHPFPSPFALMAETRSHKSPALTAGAGVGHPSPFAVRMVVRSLIHMITCRIHGKAVLVTRRCLGHWASPPPTTLFLVAWGCPCAQPDLRTTPAGPAQDRTASTSAWSSGLIARHTGRRLASRGTA